MNHDEAEVNGSNEVSVRYTPGCQTARDSTDPNRRQDGPALMDLARLQATTQLVVRQRIRLMVNQYEVHAAGPDVSAVRRRSAHPPNRPVRMRVLRTGCPSAGSAAVRPAAS